MIAQRFNAGFDAQPSFLKPQMGAAERILNRPNLFRPSPGLWEIDWHRIPALKRWAIVDGPSGRMPEPGLIAALDFRPPAPRTPNSARRTLY
jgi:hypothetical protein